MAKGVSSQASNWQIQAEQEYTEIEKNKTSNDIDALLNFPPRADCVTGKLSAEMEFEMSYATVLLATVLFAVITVFVVLMFLLAGVCIILSEPKKDKSISIIEIGIFKIKGSKWALGVLPIAGSIFIAGLAISRVDIPPPAPSAHTAGQEASPEQGYTQPRSPTVTGDRPS